MSDRDLRRIERSLAAQPASLDLREQHARALQRVGDPRGVDALDLAWRLGVESVWEELQAALEARRLRVLDLVLCYVPGGPFVMGIDDGDVDAAPPHRVDLSGFYMAERTLTCAQLVGIQGSNEFWKELTDLPATLRPRQLDEALEHMTKTRSPAQRGTFLLPTEAQWERAFRAAYLRREGGSPYGVVPTRRTVEWTRDRYEEDAYAQGPRRDPSFPEEGKWRAVRGVPGLKPPHHAVYREAVADDGQFQIETKDGARRWLWHERGIEARVVFQPA